MNNEIKERYEKVVKEIEDFRVKAGVLENNLKKAEENKKDLIKQLIEAIPGIKEEQLENVEFLEKLKSQLINQFEEKLVEAEKQIQELQDKYDELNGMTS